MFVLVKELKQLDNHSFEISWTDGATSVFHLSYLQRNCPCAVCFGKEVKVDDAVKAFRIVNVGLHALRIDFTSGCSKGIFTFSFLRKLSLGDK